MSGRLDGVTLLVTGGTRGIGRAVVAIREDANLDPVTGPRAATETGAGGLSVRFAS